MSDAIGDFDMDEQERTDELMSAKVPNVHDPDIRAMVLLGHRPEEFWSFGGQLQWVGCEVCGQAWPCPSIEAARAIEEGQRADAPKD